MKILSIFLLFTSYSFAQLIKVEDWKIAFDSNVSEDAYQLELSNNNDSDDCYYLDFTTYTNMYEATGDEKYLDFALKLYENKIAQSSIITNGYYGWLRDADNSNGGITNGGHGLDNTEIVLSQTRGFGRTAARMFWVLNRAENYLKKKNNQARFNKNYNWFKKNICDKWFSFGIGNIYRINTHMSSHWAQIGFFMNEIEPNKKYRKWFDDWNSNISKGNYDGSMRSQFREVMLQDGIGWIWSNEWGNMDNVTDTNHANAEVEIIIYGAEFEDYWTLDDIDKIKKNFNQNIFIDKFNGAEFIDGSCESESRQVWSQGWLKLGRFDKKLQERLQIRNYKTDRSFKYYKRAISEMAYNKAFLDNRIHPLKEAE